MKLQFIPALQRLDLNWNVVAIWQSISDDQEPEEAVFTASPAPWILWRHNLISSFSSLKTDEVWALDAAINQVSFGEICAGLCQWVTDENAGLHAASLLKGWLDSGLIANIIVEENK